MLSALYFARSQHACHTEWPRRLAELTEQQVSRQSIVAQRMLRCSNTASSFHEENCTSVKDMSLVIATNGPARGDYLGKESQSLDVVQGELVINTTWVSTGGMSHLCQI